MSQENEVLRTPALRPTLRQVIVRLIATTLVLAAVPSVTSWLLGDFDIDRPRDALLAGLVIGLVNALIWPALAVVLVPLSVFTLGLASLAVNAAMIWLVLDELPGVLSRQFRCCVVGHDRDDDGQTLFASVLHSTTTAGTTNEWRGERLAKTTRPP